MAFDESEGKSAFGGSAKHYNAVRPVYPDWMFEQLVLHGALFNDANTLELGAGNGLATRKLIEKGAAPLTIVEPDVRFASYLNSLEDHAGCATKNIYDTFEDADLPDATFDLIVIATAFHWLDPNARVERLAKLLRPEGYVALCWNVFQDLHQHDDFHEATKSVLGKLESSPSGEPDKVPFALDVQTRQAEFVDSGKFHLKYYDENRWPLELNPEQVRGLYAGFSNISRLDEPSRESILDELAAIAENQFAGKVVRNMTSPLYLFQRS